MVMHLEVDIDSSVEHSPLPRHNKLFQVHTQDFI